MEITRSQLQTGRSPAKWFTGDVYVDPIAAPSGRSQISASLVHFTPGARTAWHTHPNGQTIFVLEGVGLCQRRGGPVEVIRPGDRVFFEPGEEPWHGGAANRFMTHIAMLDVDDHGNSADWGEHVSDDEYAQAPTGWRVLPARMDATTTCHMSISLDGYVAGPDQNLEHPLGRGGIELHHWHLDEPLNDADRRARDLLLRPRGAYVMGRNMFGPVRGSWQGDWRGWWGEEPPYHAPVFVLTHFERDPIEMAGGTTFHFVTDGFEVAFARASEAAGDRGVDIAGGASTVRQALAAGVIDELVLDFVPVLLGAGERLFDGVPDPGFEPVEVIHSPLATHVRYVRHGAADRRT
jgi:quercetin dioxygenase-like cupin family protein/dihydrofolate reductase